jgi:hypothetical protein
LIKILTSAERNIAFWKPDILHRMSEKHGSCCPNLLWSSRSWFSISWKFSSRDSFLFLFCLGALVPVRGSERNEWVHLSCVLVFGEVVVPDDRKYADLSRCEKRRKKNWVF